MALWRTSSFEERGVEGRERGYHRDDYAAHGCVAFRAECQDGLCGFGESIAHEQQCISTSTTWRRKQMYRACVKQQFTIREERAVDDLGLIKLQSRLRVGQNLRQIGRPCPCHPFALRPNLQTSRKQLCAASCTTSRASLSGNSTAVSSTAGRWAANWSGILCASSLRMRAPA